MVMDWKRSGEHIMPQALKPVKRGVYLEWLAYTLDNERAETAEHGVVPSHTYFFMSGQRILGAVNVRHQLTKSSYIDSGHIDYGIRPSERGKGYAKIMLELTLKLAKQLGLTTVVLAIAKGNVRSAKTAISCGAVLANEVVVKKVVIQRYYISLANTETEDAVSAL
jgi:predicted acetyltransferase